MTNSQTENIVSSDSQLNPRADLATIDATLARVKSQEVSLWRSLAGVHFDSLITDRDFCENCLSNPDQNLRIAAIFVLTRYWKVGREITPELQKMALEDSDPQVRGVALTALGGIYMGSQDTAIGRYFASLTANDQLDPKARRLAYGCLFQLRGAEPDLWPDNVPGFRFPEDVDWALVNGFLGTTR